MCDAKTCERNTEEHDESIYFIRFLCGIWLGHFAPRRSPSARIQISARISAADAEATWRRADEVVRGDANANAFFSSATVC